MGGISGGGGGLTIPFNQHLLLGAGNTYDLGSAATDLRYLWVTGGINSSTAADQIFFRNSATAVRFDMGTGVGANWYFRSLTDAQGHLGDATHRWLNIEGMTITGHSIIQTAAGGILASQGLNSSLLVPLAQPAVLAPGSLWITGSGVGFRLNIFDGFAIRQFIPDM